MTNSTTAHTQRQSHRRLRKRKHFTETTGSSKPSKHILVDAALSKRQQPYSLIPTPPLTEALTQRKAADTVSHSEHYNSDHIWDLIRESKARQYSSDLCLANLCPATMKPKDDSAITVITTTTQRRKDDQRFAEEMLHPRWIAIQREGYYFKDCLSVIQKIVQEASDGDGESNQQSPNFDSIIGDELFASIGGDREVLVNKLRFLEKSQASEPQWEARLWRRWFFKDSVLEPDRNRPDLKPFMGQIVQAKMALLNDGAVFPPLLASADHQRESRLFITSIPWSPDLKNQKGNHILRYPNYLYAVSQSSLMLRKKDFCPDGLPAFRFEKLPAFRLSQYKYLPANWMVEIKSENTDANHLAVENYSAFISAYLLHERLLLHWIAKNQDIESNNPVELSDNLAVHCITCCGQVCKIWRMSIRKWTKETSSDLEPVRYDMRLLDTLDLEEGDGDQRLCDWINALNALALTVQFEDIITDLKDIGIRANENKELQKRGQTYSWTSKVGFVYKAGSTMKICVAPLGKLRKAYRSGDIRADERIGDKVIGWDEEGQPLEIDITRKGGQVPDPGTSSALPSAPPAGISRKVPEPSTSSALSSASSAGNPQITLFTSAELYRLSSPGVKSIAETISDYINMKEDIGSTKDEHVEYITNTQEALAAAGMQMDLLDIWKSMGLSKGDIRKLRIETLRTIYNSIGAGDLGPKAAKKDLIEALSTK